MLFYLGPRLPEHMILTAGPATRPGNALASAFSGCATIATFHRAIVQDNSARFGANRRIPWFSFEMIRSNNVARVRDLLAKILPSNDQNLNRSAIV
jgi:hypothetical protein